MSMSLLNWVMELSVSRCLTVSVAISKHLVLCSKDHLPIPVLYNNQAITLRTRLRIQTI